MSQGDSSIHGLRNELFSVLRQYRDGKIDAKDAKAICEIAQVILNSAKVEIDHMRVINASSPSRFMEHNNSPAVSNESTETPRAPALETPTSRDSPFTFVSGGNVQDIDTSKPLPKGVVGVRRHTMR